MINEAICMKIRTREGKVPLVINEIAQRNVAHI